MELSTSLPMDDPIFFGLLRQKNLFPANLEEQVQAKPTRAEKTKLFLDKIIDCSLSIDYCEPLCNLLTAMSDENYLHSDHLKQLATRIRQEINGKLGALLLDKIKAS